MQGEKPVYFCQFIAVKSVQSILFGATQPYCFRPQSREALHSPHERSRAFGLLSSVGGLGADERVAALRSWASPRYRHKVVSQAALLTGERGAQMSGGAQVSWGVAV